MKKFVILISVYNDWKSVFKLIENIDIQISNWEAAVSVIIINDASTIKPKLSLKNARLVDSCFLDKYDVIISKIENYDF